MRVGIVGSRRRSSTADQLLVYQLVHWLRVTHGPSTVIVSGGCRGPDTFAVQAARYYGLSFKEHLPRLDPPVKSYAERVERFYERNGWIAEDSDELYALVASDRKGGTENTITWVYQLQRPVHLL